MPLHNTLLATPLIAALSACTPPQTATPDSHPAPEPAPEPAPAIAAQPPPEMAPFARLVGGLWRITLASGATHEHTWRWGPGKYSLRKMSDDPAVATNPWAGEVLYWHPGRKQVRVLSIHGDIPAVGRGVAEGTIAFDGDTADGPLDLDQPRGRRKLGAHWAFDGPDKYRDTLLEDTGAGLQPMNGWDVIRIRQTHDPRPRPTAAPQTLPNYLKAFEPLVRHTWKATTQTKGAAPAAAVLQTRSTFEWIPSVEVLCARVTAQSEHGDPADLLDAYLFQDVRTDAVRCLALSNLGGRPNVYEGEVTVPDADPGGSGDALQLDLTGHEGDRSVRYLVRIGLEPDGTLRTRIWSLRDAERTLALDLQHTKHE